MYNKYRFIPIFQGNTMLETYLPRVADDELSFRLETFGAVLIEGPKWCGKTTTAQQHSKSALYLQDPDMREEYLQTADVKPSLLLAGKQPRLLDEWQDAPVLWDAVRTSVDREKREGLYILTGSTSVDTSAIKHSGTGRISRMKMYPMSLAESGESNGQISLKALFDREIAEVDSAQSDLKIEELVFAACRGGWPESLRRKNDRARLAIAKDYLRQVYEVDISTVDRVARNPTWASILLRSYARNVSTLAKNKAIFEDVTANTEMDSILTMNSYIEALERIFVIENQSAWTPRIRSATSIRSGVKRQFTDPSIAVSALGVSPDFFYQDLKTFGFIFETLCVRDLRVYSSSAGGKISFFRDRYGLEADAVVHLDDGRYALVEFKLGSREIEAGAAHLLKIRELVRKANTEAKKGLIREPDLLIVLTGGRFAYTRKDGVHVIPIGCLGA
ncbi:MAG: DUF4143 domain-containing protein [Mobiluncus porci]|uniref:ATP-binding protein n=1 Tax=Mobiluncus TaxID=2050 RepID=UPI0023F4BCFF|nr:MULTISPECIES: DUF4143 domain-containing protein [Mobiluncus]MCI6584395.1 DUF4143 domain-containing protein [Mobiluncus sp.]MDD7541815.1 DUF4143 domain-containing protein [Mobiluncus porci]MDY5748663.1 DUF4143 domain-containing protein [Mobiluncus porci]